MTRFVISLRTLSDEDFGNSLGGTRYLAVPDDRDPLPSDEVSRTTWIKQIMATFPRSASGDSVTGDLVFFVHGYNQGINDVVSQQSKIIAGLAAATFPCTVVAFDWPSEKNTFTYLPQLDVAKRSAIELVNAAIVPFLKSQTPKCRVAVHAICHSMGAYVIREALDHADDGTFTGSDWTLNQLLLVAGDVEASDFVDGNKNTDSMLGHCYRLTNYFNLYDEVLQISNAKRIGVEPRVGRIGLPPDAPAKTANIDCSARFEAVKAKIGGDPIAIAQLSHSWYFGDRNFYVDVAATLRGTVDRVVTANRVVEIGKTLGLAV